MRSTFLMVSTAGCRRWLRQIFRALDDLMMISSVTNGRTASYEIMSSIPAETWDNGSRPKLAMFST